MYHKKKEMKNRMWFVRSACVSMQLRSGLKSAQLVYEAMVFIFLSILHFCCWKNPLFFKKCSTSFSRIQCLILLQATWQKTGRGMSRPLSDMKHHNYKEERRAKERIWWHREIKKDLSLVKNVTFHKKSVHLHAFYYLYGPIASLCGWKTVWILISWLHLKLIRIPSVLEFLKTLE